MGSDVKSDDIRDIGILAQNFHHTVIIDTDKNLIINVAEILGKIN